MTNLPPSEPESSQKTALGFDEFIAILVAFLTLGGILFWSISRSESGWDFKLLPDVSPSAESKPIAPSPVLGLQPDTDDHSRTSSRVDVTVAEPSTTTRQVFPFVNEVVTETSPNSTPWSQENVSRKL